jgi:transcriptional regulator with XRE-family HTH domain
MRVADVELIVEARELLRSGRAARIRIEAGLSQSELARALGVSPGAVCRWEAGSRLPREREAVRFARLNRQLSAMVASLRSDEPVVAGSVASPADADGEDVSS